MKRVAAIQEVSRLLPGHHALGLRQGFLQEVCAAFDNLEETGKLRYGTGVHDYGDFSIKL